MSPPAPSKRGFACGSNAADAARKNHKLGTAHQWTKLTARKAAKKRWKKTKSAEH